MSTKKPIKEFRMGAVKASVWANETSKGVFHNVTIQRLYKDGEDWKSSESFGRDDLPLVLKVVEKAHDWIYEQGRKE